MNTPGILNARFRLYLIRLSLKSAKVFHDYAMLELGIPAGNIEELVNVDAYPIDVSLAIK